MGSVWSLGQRASRAGLARKARRAGLVRNARNGSIWSIRSVSSIWLGFRSGQQDKPDKRNKRDKPNEPERRARADGGKRHGVRKNLSCRFQRLALRDRYEADFDALLQGHSNSIEHHEGVPFVVCVFQPADD